MREATAPLFRPERGVTVTMPGEINLRVTDVDNPITSARRTLEAHDDPDVEVEAVEVSITFADEEGQSESGQTTTTTSTSSSGRETPDVGEVVYPDSARSPPKPDTKAREAALALARTLADGGSEFVTGKDVDDSPEWPYDRSVTSQLSDNFRNRGMFKRKRVEADSGTLEYAYGLTEADIKWLKGLDADAA